MNTTVDGVRQHAETMIEASISANEDAAGMIVVDAVGWAERHAEHRRRGQRGELVGPPIDRHSLLDCLHNFQIIQLVLWNGQRIIGEDHQVGEFANLDGAFCLFFEVLPGRPNRQRLQRVGDRDAVPWSENVPAA